MIAAGHPQTCRVAQGILGDGGNAVDAALGAMCAACVVEPALASLGGGGFLMAHDAGAPFGDRTVLYDFFTQTPRQKRSALESDFRPIDADFGPVRQRFHIGLGAMATPGVIKGVFTAHRERGRMPLKSVLEPAISLARDGVAVNAFQAYAFQVIRSIIEARSASMALFASPSRPGALIGEGEILRAPALADTLEILAIEGDDLFYRGEIGVLLAQDCAQGGGHLTREDLRGYRVERRRPLAIEAFGARILLNPPPSSGGVLIAFPLALLEALGIRDHSFGAPEYMRLLADAMAATNRARIEARLHEKEPDAASDALLHPQLLARFHAEILGRPQASHGTTHISVVDGDGNAASLSISNGEGSAYVIPGTGIMMNNMLGEDDVNPEGLQAWCCDVRMASMMAPTLAWSRDGTMIALGSGGSSRIRSAILQVLLNMIVSQMGAEEAVAAPRLHLENDTLNIEPGFADGGIGALARHYPRIERWEEKNMFFGGVHVAARDAAGGADGAGDARRGGAVVSG